MNRIDIINSLIKKNNYQTYLEIGCQNDVCFNQIEISSKVGVDPEKGGNVRMTSDEYFDQWESAKNAGFDIIFIDGLHEADQVHKDIINALECLNENGIIVCHDMNPSSELSQRVPRETKVWNGDCWKAFVKLRSENKDLEMRVVDTDHGCGIIEKGIQKLITISKEGIDYLDLEANREEWLNLISVEEFKLLYL